MRPWEVLSSRTLLERKWLTVREQSVALPTGARIDEFHLLESPDWVGVLALTPAGELVMVEQYRHGAGRTSLELPAGVIDPGEQPLTAAIRELREETGYAADAFEPLVVVRPEPARGTNRAHFYVAREARRVSGQSLDESENIRVRTLAKPAVMQAIDAGQLIHGSHLGALLLAERRGLW